MPWCARCGTGISQMEMNEGYQDREDPGLTVRFPLVDRPGEALLVWTTTPWTLTSNVAAAVGEELRYVRVRQGDDVFWLGKGTLKHGARRARSRSLEERPGSRPRRLALRRARSTSCRRSARRSRGRSPTRGRALRAPGRRLGRGRRGGGDRHRPHRARAAAPRTSSSARRSACRSSRRSTSTASSSTGFGSLTGRDVRDVAEPIVEHLEAARAASTGSRPYHPPLPALLAVRDAARLPPRRRVVHLHGPGLRPAARDADRGAGRRQPALPDHGGRRPDPLDPGVRLRPRARLAAATCTTG